MSGTPPGALCSGAREALRGDPWSPELPDLLLPPVLTHSFSLPLVTQSLSFCVFWKKSLKQDVDVQ